MRNLLELISPLKALIQPKNITSWNMGAGKIRSESNVFSHLAVLRFYQNDIFLLVSKQQHL